MSLMVALLSSTTAGPSSVKVGVPFSPANCGASLTALTVMPAVSNTSEYAVESPAGVGSAVAPSRLPSVWSQARNVIDDVPLKFAFGWK